MKLTAYHRAVREFLRDGYGVTEVRWVNGANHPRAEFQHAGQRHQLTLHRQPGGRQSTTEMKLRDIRRELGEPTYPQRPGVLRRTLEEMTVDLQENARTTMTSSLQPALTTDPIGEAPPDPQPGFVGIYRDRIRFNVPADIATRFGGVGVAARLLPDRETWELRPDPKARRTINRSEASPTGYGMDDMSRAAGGGTLPPCGHRSPATYLLAGDTVLVHCPPATRLPLSANAKTEGDAARYKRKAKTAKAEVPTPRAEPAPREVEVARTWPASAPTAEQMREVLEAIRHVEALTPYRLMRNKESGAWVFAAPRIE